MKASARFVIGGMLAEPCVFAVHFCTANIALF